MPRLDPATLDFLAGGGLLLTANRRQSRYLLARHAEAMQDAGRAVWPTPSILPLDAWLRAAADHALALDRLPARRILDEPAALWLWREAVLAEPTQSLADAADVAVLARRAWLTLRLHGGTLAQLAATATTVDHRCLLGWATHVEARLDELAAIDAALLRLDAAALVAVEPPAGVLFAGHDAGTPAFPLVQAAFATHGAVRDPGWRRPGQVVCCGAADPAEELERALGWLRQGLDADRDARFGLIVPDLESRRGAIERQLVHVLQPSLEAAGSGGLDRCFDLSVGAPLDTRGIAACALDLLVLDARHWPFERISRLLRARWIVGHESEGEARVRLDAELRRLGRIDWTPAALAAEARRRGCPQFAAAVDGHAARLAATVHDATLEQHVRELNALLTHWQWPGPHALDSDDFQAVEAWHAALAEVAALAPLAGRVTRSFAVGELTRRCRQPFQPERGLPRVLVQGSFDDPGVPLDGLWVLGLGADAWPRPATPEPLLPVLLQRRLGVVGSSPALRLAEAGRIRQAWQEAAGQLVLSWPRHRDDAAVPRSPLIDPSTSELAAPPPRTPRRLNAFEARALEPAPRDVATALEPARARGGARLPQLQAQCPFRAFAELRLAARPLDEPAPGVPPLLRGTLLHGALERLWARLGNRAALAALDADARARLLQQVAAEAAAAAGLDGAGRRTADLELEWQRRALAELVELDLARPDFEVVALEHEYRVELGGLPLTLKVDRVDRVAGRLVLIDYKTAGVQSPKATQWSGARPDAPQLPLYAVTWPGDVAGIAFAIAGRDGAELVAVAADGALFGTAQSELARFRYDEEGNTGDDWEAQLGRWQAVLARLVTAHAAGEAQVAAKRPQVCRTCALPTLCRVRPEDTGGDDDAEDADDAAA